MTTALRAGTSNDGYWQVNTTDVLKITGGRLDITGNTYATSGSAAVSQYFILNKAGESATNESGLVAQTAGVNRWAIMLGSLNTSDFVLRRYSDVGAVLSDAIVINRASGHTTFAGTMTVNTNGGSLSINTTSGDNMLAGTKAGVTRWSVQLGNGTTESGSNAGTDFIINRYSDAGAFIANAMVISRQSGLIAFNGTVIPSATNTHDLGRPAERWRNIYTNDLHLSNGIGDYTIVEGEEDLFLYNNKNGKTYKFALIPVDPSEVPAKAKV